MPKTWEDITRQLGYGNVSRHEARYAIEGGAYYMMKLRRSWSADRPTVERHRLALASYNAGMGSILKAQKSCGGARFWAEIAPCLGLITGKANARQTIDYVDRIAKWRILMEAGR